MSDITFVDREEDTVEKSKYFLDIPPELKSRISIMMAAIYSLNHVLSTDNSKSCFLEIVHKSSAPISTTGIHDRRLVLFERPGNLRDERYNPLSSFLPFFLDELYEAEVEAL